MAWEPAHGEFAALLRELELIRRWRPRFNVQGQPNRRRRTYVCVGREPAPYLFLSPKPPGTAFAGFGPVPGGVTAREAVRRLNDWFRLRDCPQAQKMVFADQRGLFPLDLRRRLPARSRSTPASAPAPRPARAAITPPPCGPPCASSKAPTPRRWRRWNGPCKRRRRRRRSSAPRPCATSWQPMHWLSGHLERVRQACRRSCVYPAVGRDGSRGHWYVIHHGRVRAVAPAPRDDAARSAALAALDAAFHGGASGPPGPDEIDGVLLVAAWFRRHPAEKDRALAPAAARTACAAT